MKKKSSLCRDDCINFELIFNWLGAFGKIGCLGHEMHQMEGAPLWSTIITIILKEYLLKRWQVLAAPHVDPQSYKLYALTEKALLAIA